jgi:hypothetical protein
MDRTVQREASCRWPWQLALRSDQPCELGYYDDMACVAPTVVNILAEGYDLLWSHQRQPAIGLPRRFRR